MEACELRLERDPEAALAILAAVSCEEGKDGGRVGVAGLRPEAGRCLASDTGDIASEAEEDDDADAAAAVATERFEEEEADGGWFVRPGGGGLSLQSWPSSGEGTNPPEGLG